jgi:hypothetical protein
MNASLSESKLQSSDIYQLSAYGASNAIGSISEYEHFCTILPNDIAFYVCYAHQINTVVDLPLYYPIS